MDVCSGSSSPLRQPTGLRNRRNAERPPDHENEPLATTPVPRLRTPTPAATVPRAKHSGMGMSCQTSIRHLNVRRMPLGTVTKHPGVTNVLQVRLP